MAKKTKRRPALVRLMLDNRRHWPGLIWLTALMLVSGLFKSLSADYLGRAVDQGMAGDFQAMSWSIGVTLLMVLADAVRLGVFNVETARTVERMFLDVKRQVFGSVAGCQLSAFEHGMQGGDVLSRVTDDLPALSRSFSETFTWLISVFCRGVVALAFCIGVSWELSAVYLVITPLLIWTMNKIGKPIQELQTKASRSGGKAYSIMSEMLQNNAAIKAFGAEEAMDQRFAGEVESQRQGLDQAARKGTILTLTAYLSDVVLIAVVFLFGGWLIATGQISVGAFVTFVTLSGSIREAFSLLDKSMSTLRQAEAYALRIYEVLDLPQEKSQTAPTSPIQKSSREAVTMEGLSFSYLPGKPVLQGMELHVKPGEHVGVIGPSGCGKTTLLRLICGLYQGYEGDLRVLGRTVAETPLEELREDIAVVSQEPHLFRGTIAENVRYGKLDATDAQVEQALRDARLWDFVESLEEGINTQVGDAGSRLSGGQRQRIAIARALIRGAGLIILDEASSALDTKTEGEIQHTMDEAFRDKTVLVIAHRFTAVAHMDRVYCMENGRVVEQGTVKELLSRDSLLRQMAQTQGGGRNE